MNIPNYINGPLVDENGNATSEWSNNLTQLITELQLNLSNEGYKLPQQSTTSIDALTDANKSTGAMIYDSTTNEMKVNIAGTWKVVNVT